MGMELAGLWFLNQAFVFCFAEEMEGEEVVRELEEEVRFAFMGAFSKIRLQLRFPFLTTVSNKRSPNPPPTQSHSFLLCTED